MTATEKGKHTPEPWHTDVEWANVVFAGNGTEKRVCYCYSAHSDIADAEAESNARLIGAAPDLLSAAKAKLADCEGCKDAALMEGEVCSNECAALMAAIYKAEGRS